MNNIVRIISVFMNAFLDEKVFYHSYYFKANMATFGLDSSDFYHFKFPSEALATKPSGFFCSVQKPLLSRMYLQQTALKVSFGISDIKSNQFLCLYEPKLPNHLL